MSGIPVPQYPIVRPFGNPAIAPADPGGTTLPVPVASQVGVLVGAASFEDGFPASTMTDPEVGGVAPYGQDMNGLLYMATAYCALIQAGQRAVFNAAAAAAFVGYAVGAELASVTTPGRIWKNLTDGNTNDPDVDDTGWYANEPLYLMIAPAAGTYNDYVLPGASDFVLDIDTTSGVVDFTGFVAQRNGQRLFLTPTGVNNANVLANNGGSTANNQVRAATDLSMLQNMTLTLEWFAGLNRWLIV